METIQALCDRLGPSRCTFVGFPNVSYNDVLDPTPPLTLYPGEMEAVSVVFSPSRPGHYCQRLLVGSTDPDEPVVEVLLEGSGVSKRNR